MIANDNNENALIVVDNALRAFSEATPENKGQCFLNLIEAIALKVLIPASEEPLKCLFEKSMRHQDRRFVAICLLRILSIDDSILQENVMLRAKTYDLFDEVFDYDIYKALKINTSQQTYEKQSVLKDIVSDVEAKMNKVIDSLLNLDVVTKFRQEFMKTFKSPIVNAVLVHFLPQNLLIDTRLSEIFYVCDSYCQIRSIGALGALDKASEARSVLLQYEQEANNYGTHYSTQYLAGFARKLIILIDEDVARFDASKPANLHIKASGKKYPFHNKGRQVDLSFIVENFGPGYAYDVEVIASSPIDNLSIVQPRIHLGRLEPSSQGIVFPTIVVTKEQIAIIELHVKWKNFNRSNEEKKFEIELHGQRTDLNWDEIANEEPYSLEAVESKAELVGRDTILHQIERQAHAKSVGSCYLYGQKRVGKTSIARTIKSHIESDNYLVIYMESGDYIRADGRSTVNQMGKRLCEKIRTTQNRFSNIEVPEFVDGSLSSLSDYLDSVLLIAPEYRILFVLDEFDSLPIELFKRGNIADAFFLTLRSISGKTPFGFILVGGENIEFIMSCQGDVLNKFRALRVDYFDREHDWNDFQELVRRPTKKWFDISDEAIAKLYEQTAGNPFYTKWICGKLFELMTERRDSHVTETEIIEAFRESIFKIASNSFQHLWEDGIFVSTGDREEEISIMRRKILLALASVLRRKEKASKEDILDQEILRLYQPTQVENELHKFVSRQVLMEESNNYHCKVKFFQDWLLNVGSKQIMTEFADLETIIQRRKQEDDLYIRSNEIVDLVSQWGIYRGNRITEDRVRLWLSQFGDIFNQRMMFKILQKTIFYTTDRIRQKMTEAHGIINRGLIKRWGGGQRKRDDIIVSYLDSPGKSGGGTYAKLFADENNIYVNNVVEKNSLAHFLKNISGTKALVFIDDFIGTGTSAKEYFTTLVEESGEVLRQSNLTIYFIVICGFQDKKSELETYLSNIKLPINVHICDPIDEGAKCFSEKSTIFPDVTEREKAKSLAYEHGIKLVKKNPLGYGNCQTAIIFDQNCPNNNLPILWAASEDPPWKPLFKRL